MRRRHVAAASSSLGPPTGADGFGPDRGEPYRADTNARPDSPKKRCIPGSTHQHSRFGGDLRCRPSGRHLPQSLGKVTKGHRHCHHRRASDGASWLLDTTDVTTIGAVFGSTDQPTCRRDRLPSVADRSAQSRRWTPLAGRALSVRWHSWRSTSCRRGTMPASARVSSAHRSVPSKSTPPGGAPSNTVITQSWQARPRAAQQSQSTIMLAPFR